LKRKEKKKQSNNVRAARLRPAHDLLVLRQGEQRDGECGRDEASGIGRGGGGEREETGGE